MPCGTRPGAASRSAAAAGGRARRAQPARAAATLRLHPELKTCSESYCCCCWGSGAPCAASSCCCHPAPRPHSGIAKKAPHKDVMQRCCKPRYCKRMVGRLAWVGCPVMLLLLLRMCIHSAQVLPADACTGVACSSTPAQGVLCTLGQCDMPCWHRVRLRNTVVTVSAQAIVSIRALLPKPARGARGRYLSPTGQRAGAHRLAAQRQAGLPRGPPYRAPGRPPRAPRHARVRPPCAAPAAAALTQQAHHVIAETDN